jgi:hypothetical protein
MLILFSMIPYRFLNGSGFWTRQILLIDSMSLWVVF